MKEIAALTNYIDYLPWYQNMLVPKALKQTLFDPRRSYYRVMTVAIESLKYSAAWLLPGLRYFFQTSEFLMCLWLHEKKILSEELLNHDRLVSIYRVLKTIEEQSVYIIGDEFRAYKDAFLSHSNIDSLCNIFDILLKNNLLNNVTIIERLDVLLALDHTKLLPLLEILILLDQRYDLQDYKEAESHLHVLMSHDNLESLYTAMCILLNQEDDVSIRKKISRLFTVKPRKDIEPSALLNEFVDLSEEVTDSLSWRLPESAKPSPRIGLEIFGFCQVRSRLSTCTSVEISPQKSILGFVL